MSLRERVHRLLLTLQGRAWRLPAPIRKLARRLMRRVEQDVSEIELETWESPLVQPGSNKHEQLEPPPSVAVEPGGADDESPRSVQGHCVVLTDVLDVGGVDEFAALLAKRLPSVGWRVSVVKTGVPGGYLADQLIHEGVSVTEAPSPDDLVGVLRRLDPDVISAHAPLDWALDCAHVLGIPVVEVLHGAPTPLTTNWGLEERRSRKVTAFITVSEFVRQHYLSGNPDYPTGAVIAVPIGYDPTARPRVDRGRARAWLGLTTQFLFTSLGRCSAEKNTYGLVDAFAQVARSVPDAHLLVAGRVDDRTYAWQVLRMIESQPEEVRRRIHLRDNTSAVSAVLAASDCFVMDSFYEGWGMASVEALAAGVPIIRSDTGGALEQIGAGGERGYLVGNPIGPADSVTWESISRSRFIEQANRNDLIGAMEAAVSARPIWADKRDTLATESQGLFPIVDFVGRHGAILTHAVAHPTSADFANSPWLDGML